MNVGPALVRTVVHFWPEFNSWLDRVPDRCRADRVVYHKRLLLWLGLALFLFKLGSRRQLDYELPKGNRTLLDNLNRLAATQQKGLPVNKTIDDFLGGVGPAPLERLRHLMVGRLIRNKVFDAARGQGKTVLGLFGSIKNIAKRLRDSFVRVRITDEAYDKQQASKIQIRLATWDSS